MSRKIAVVTGAGSGIGAAVARTLSGRDHDVIVTDLDESAAARVAGDLHAEHRQLDVTDDDAVTEAAAEICRRRGQIDVWVNNAGISAMTKFLDVPTSQLDRSLAVNLRAVFVGTQAAARQMVRTGTHGRIVNLASMAGKQGRVPFLADYVAAKFGVVGLTQAAAFELAEHNITVNCVCPGYVTTSMQSRELAWEATLRGITTEAVRHMMVDDTPLRRLENPEDVARAIAFLVSEDAAFITGEALAVNGGAYMD